jgi:hypothetical protein
VRRIAALLAALATGAALPGAAGAQSVTAGGSLTGRIGYGSNPYLNLNSPGGSGVAGGNLTGWLQNRSETSSTRLTGVVDIDQNFQYYGRAENYQALLDHQQTISDKLSVRVGARYSDAINPRNFQVDSNAAPIDLLSIGQRSRNISANGTVQWAPTSRDSFYIGPQYSHTTYPGGVGSSYNSYGMSGGYLRQVSAKMKVGVDLSVQKVNSQGFSNSTSYQGGVRLVYDFSPIWQFDGNVGLIHQTSSFGNSSTPGFSANLCGKYPRYNICLEASRQSAASGFGGLRTDNRIGANVGYDLSSRSHLKFGAVYDISQSSGISIVPTQKYWEISGGYSRTITTRLSGGFSGRYQNRNYGSLAGVNDSTVSGYAATLDVTYKFGRND